MFHSRTPGFRGVPRRGWREVTRTGKEGREWERSKKRGLDVRQQCPLSKLSSGRVGKRRWRDHKGMKPREFTSEGPVSAKKTKTKKKKQLGESRPKDQKKGQSGGGNQGLKNVPISPTRTQVEHSMRIKGDSGEERSPVRALPYRPIGSELWRERMSRKKHALLPREKDGREREWAVWPGGKG